MVVYSVEKLIAQAKQLAADYKKTTGKTLPGVSVEIAEHDAARLLDLDLCADRSAGYDAVGKGGKRIQIKGRAIFDDSKSGYRIGQIKVDKPWDSIVLVLMNEDYEPFEIYEADREVILDVLGESSASQKKRGALSVSRFRIIADLVWTREEGLIGGIWDNALSS